MDDTLGRGRNHRQADLGEGKSRCVEHPRDLRRHVAHLLLPGSGDEIASEERPPEEVALERLRRALQPHVLLGRSEHHPLSRARFALAHGDVLARADIGIGTLQPVEPDHLQPFVLGIGIERTRSGQALALDLDHVAFGHPKFGERRLGQPGNAVTAFFLPCRRHLQPHGPFNHVCARLCHRFRSVSPRADAGRDAKPDRADKS